MENPAADPLSGAPERRAAGQGAGMAILRIDDDTTKADIETAIGFINAELRRMPEHWIDRRAALHAKIDVLLEDWMRAPA